MDTFERQIEDMQIDRQTVVSDRLGLLREPFKPHQISKLPKPMARDAPKGRCAECGGWHGLPAVHLDYVGHAALTDRLLDVDPSWTWEPLALNKDGLPLLDEDGGMWIRLTICGVTRLGYGDAQGKSGGDAVKERIGDALRNAAMRFGAALDLWHKGDLHEAEKEEPKPARGSARGVATEAFDALDPGAQEVLRSKAQYVQELYGAKGIVLAVNALHDLNLDNESKLAMWSLFDSEFRSNIKREEARRTVKEVA